MKTAIIYVQLGENPAKTLYLFASQAKKALPQSKLFLVTDSPGLWQEFPGQVIDVSSRGENNSFLGFRKQNKELERIAGGYWLNTLKRLFVLEVMQDFSIDWDDLLHFESDVYSFVSNEMVKCLRCRVNSTAIPRFSENRGIASVVYVRSLPALKKMISDFSQILGNNPTIRDDMELLGIALNTGVLSELPSLPADGWAWNKERYVFDGAAYGQYIFGQDPFHTDGNVISGFQNPHFNFDVSLAKWQLDEQESGSAQLKFKVKEDEWILANLHVHSKILLAESSLSDPVWRKYLTEANNQTARIPIAATETSVHSKKLDLRTRFRIAQKKGLINTILKKIRKI